MTHNPYAPPAAPVTNTVPPVEIPRPWQVKAAIWLCWISLALMIPDYLIEMFSEPEADMAEYREVTIVFFAVFLVATVALSAWVFVSIARGRRWARIVYVVLAVIGFAFASSGIPETFAVRWWSGVVYSLSVTMDIATLILLFVPASNAWFQAQHEARGG